MMTGNACASVLPHWPLCHHPPLPTRVAPLPQPYSPPKPWTQCANMMTGIVQFEKCLARLTSGELGKRNRS